MDSPLSCSMKHTFPCALKARVSGVMHSVWNKWEGLMLCSAWTHSAHTAHTSSSDRQLSRSERMSASETFSCGQARQFGSDRWPSPGVKVRQGNGIVSGAFNTEWRRPPQVFACRHHNGITKEAAELFFKPCLLGPGN